MTLLPFKSRAARPFFPIEIVDCPNASGAQAGSFIFSRFFRDIFVLWGPFLMGPEATACRGPAEGEQYQKQILISYQNKSFLYQTKLFLYQTKKKKQEKQENQQHHYKHRKSRKPDKPTNTLKSRKTKQTKKTIKTKEIQGNQINQKIHQKTRNPEKQ